MDVIVVPCLYDNYSYIISENGEAVVVDPSEAWPVLQELEKRGLDLTGVLCTHHHQDHIGGIDDLLSEYSKCRIFGFGEDRRRLGKVDVELQDGQRFSVCGLDAEILHTPGHTTGSVIYRVGDAVFTGDTLFGAGCGRLFEGTAAQMVNSLEKITNFGKDLHLFFGHEYTLTNLRFAQQVNPGNSAVASRMADAKATRDENRPTAPSTVGLELQSNPFLRCADPDIIAYLKMRNLLEDTSPLSVFTVLRELRNHFS